MLAWSCLLTSYVVICGSTILLPSWKFFRKTWLIAHSMTMLSSVSTKQYCPPFSRWGLCHCLSCKLFVECNHFIDPLAFSSAAWTAGRQRTGAPSAQAFSSGGQATRKRSSPKLATALFESHFYLTDFSGWCGMQISFKAMLLFVLSLLSCCAVLCESSETYGNPQRP